MNMRVCSVVMAQNLRCASGGNDYRAVVLRTLPVNGSDFYLWCPEADSATLGECWHRTSGATDSSSTTTLSSSLSSSVPHSPSAIWTKCRSHSLQQSGRIVWANVWQSRIYCRVMNLNFDEWPTFFLLIRCLLLLLFFLHTKMSCRHHSREPAHSDNDSEEKQKNVVHARFFTMRRKE